MDLEDYPLHQNVDLEGQMILEFYQARNERDLSDFTHFLTKVIWAFQFVGIPDPTTDFWTHVSFLKRALPKIALQDLESFPMTGCENVENMDRVEGPVLWRLWQTFGKRTLYGLIADQWRREGPLIFDLCHYYWIGQHFVRLLYDHDWPEWAVREPEECPICFEFTYSAKRPECGHAFHQSCLMTWLERKNTCPLCRDTILN